MFLATAAATAVRGAAGDPPLQEAPYAFTGVNVVAMNNDEVRHGQTVIVQGDRIVSIGAEATAVIPQGAQRIDGRGKHLMPGLADMHAHLPPGDGTGGDAATRAPAEYLGKQKEFGTVEPGKRADLLLVDGNPLADVANARKRSGLMLRGQWLPAAKLDGMLSAIATRHQTAAK